ncbi:MAG: hypothetical protein LBM03_01300 [Erysipelotrichaceae bacterium]|jgi:hypothetical protein|nr:hypothetical protein [Erysipelotrichaceae bacterium]
MKFEQIKNLKKIADSKIPFVELYETDSGDLFYVEPIFLTKLNLMLDHYPLKEAEISKEMERLVKLYKRVVFTGAFDSPLVDSEDYIYIELEDITNKLHIFVEDKSRGSDYGD